MKKTLCDKCNTEIPYEHTTIYARQGDNSKKCDLCALCIKKMDFENINWQPVIKKQYDKNKFN